MILDQDFVAHMALRYGRDSPIARLADSHEELRELVEEMAERIAAQSY